jgi:hypothetical protein
MLTRYNRKSVTVITDDSHRWNVSPGLLRKANPQGNSGMKQVVPIFKKLPHR